MPELDHTITFRTKSGDGTAYRVVVSDALEATVSSEQGEAISDRAAMGTVAGGHDSFRYSGRKEVIETNDLDDLLVSVNDMDPVPARAFGIAREADFSEEFGLGGGGGGNGGRFSARKSGGSDAEDAPAESAPSGGHRIGGDAPVWDVPGARNRDRVQAVSTQNVDLWMAPDGDDDAPGTRDAPIQSLHEVARRVPLFLLHYFVVRCKPGVYHNPSNGGMALGPVVQGFFTAAGNRQGFRIEGMGDDPGDVVFRGYPQFNINFWGCGSWDNAKITNVTLEGALSAYRGSGLGVENCVVDPNPRDPYAVGGYGGTTMLQNVHFSDSTRYAVKLKEGAEIIMNQCSGDLQRGVLDGAHGTLREAYQNEFSFPGNEWGETVNPNLPVEIVHGLDER